MSRFDFRSGNLLKLLAAPLYAAGYAASLVIPRDKNQWVFGSDTGVGAGALALYDYVQENTNDVHAVWISDDPADLTEARNHGIRAVSKGSMRGFWHTARARVVVVTHGFGDVNRYGTFGAFIVQLWHGTPLKLLHLDSPATLRVTALENFRPVVAVLRESYKRAGKQIGLFIAASDTAGERFKSGFALRNDQVAVTGDPRMDRLWSPDTAAVRRRARKTLLRRLEMDSVPQGGFILYAPTWRDGAANPITMTDRDRTRLTEFLATTGAVLIVRAHRLGVETNFEDMPGNLVSFLPDSVVADVIEVLGAIDVLITDYSAVSFDFSVTGRPIVYFAPDLDEYSKRRGLYEEFGEFTEGDYAQTWAQTVDRLEALGDPGEYERVSNRTRRLCARSQAFNDGKNTARVLAAIIRRLE